MINYFFLMEEYFMKFKDIDKQWFNELKDYVHDYIIDDYDDLGFSFITDSVDNLEEYDKYICFNVKYMGTSDYDKINKAFKKLGHDDLDAQDFSNDIYEIESMDNQLIFEDIEGYMPIPFYAIGRMGGHWGVAIKDFIKDDDLWDFDIDMKKLEKLLVDEYDLDEVDDIWDVSIDYGVASDVFDNLEDYVTFHADKSIIKNLNDAWKEIKNQSDYMLTDDYAEYIAEQITENL